MMIGSGLVVGATFLGGGQLLQGAEGIIKRGVQFIESEFANKRKNKDGDAPLTNNDNINDKMTAKERAILKDLLAPKKK